MIIALLINIEHIGRCILIVLITEFVANCQWQVVMCHVGLQCVGHFVTFATASRKQVLARITIINTEAAIFNHISYN